jgi:hypothetical protein
MKSTANATSNLRLTINEDALNTPRGWTTGLSSSMFAVAFTIALSLGGLCHAAPYGQYLSTPTATSQVGAYNDANPVSFNQNVVVGPNTDGSIAFNYDPYVGQGATPTYGGAALSGGFYLGNNVTVAAGFTLNWVQTILPTISGGTATTWNLPTMNSGEYPDADPTDAAAAAFRAAQGLPALNPTFAPAYVFSTAAAVNPPTAVPTLGFQDFPSRNFSGGAQSWVAELGLCAISTATNGMGFRTVDVIDTFLWGFNINVVPNSVSAFGPSSFSAPTTSYLNTLNSFYSGTSPSVGGNTGVTSSLYNFVYNPNVLLTVPEPGILTLLAAGSFAILVFGRLRRKSQSVGA